MPFPKIHTQFREQNSVFVKDHQDSHKFTGSLWHLSPLLAEKCSPQAKA